MEALKMMKNMRDQPRKRDKFLNLFLGYVIKLSFKIE